jgi:L-histidine N-alpha-methyltransferase
MFARLTNLPKWPGQGKLVLTACFGGGFRPPWPVSAVAHVAIHPSQFPEQIRRDLLQSLRVRQVNHKFHYDSVKQTRKWLALHQAWSPARSDADCAAIYDAGFAAAAERIGTRSVHLIGLGCGGGQKDTRLLALLARRGRGVAYTPADVSVAMVLVARAVALSVVLAKDCHPLVCDLAGAEDLAKVLARQTRPDAARLITFFGMIPNFEPAVILPRLAALLRRNDHLLFSANLAPGANYARGVRRILPQYDNELTRDWLLTFLLDLGVERRDGELRFGIADDPAGDGLKRVEARFHFARSRRVLVEEEFFEFRAGESIGLFYSYRHTPELAGALLARHGLKVLDQWIAKSGEEAVFLCRRR